VIKIGATVGAFEGIAAAPSNRLAGLAMPRRDPWLMQLTAGLAKLILTAFEKEKSKQ
jgi:hypothetical protein